MKLLTSVKGCTRLEGIKNDDIREEGLYIGWFRIICQYFRNLFLRSVRNNWWTASSNSGCCKTH